MARGAPLKLTGDKQLIKKLRKLGNVRVLKRVVRKAVNAAATPVVKAVRKEWPQDSGLSAQSVTKKVVSTRAGYVAVIGIDAKARNETHVPSKIDHLIELGWQTPEGTSVPAIAPLRKGFEKAHAAAEAKFASKVAQEIDREASKH